MLVCERFTGSRKIVGNFSDVQRIGGARGGFPRVFTALENVFRNGKTDKKILSTRDVKFVTREHALECYIGISS